MEAALGSGQMSRAAAPGVWLGAVAARAIKSVSLILLINDCVFRIHAWTPTYESSFVHVQNRFVLSAQRTLIIILKNHYI